MGDNAGISLVKQNRKSYFLLYPLVLSNCVSARHIVLVGLMLAQYRRWIYKWESENCMCIRRRNRALFA